MNPSKPKRIGLDLDNTIIDYGPAVKQISQEEGLSGVLGVRELRDYFKYADNSRWQSIQAKLYVTGLDFAIPTEGCLEFVRKATALGIEVSILSHKTLRTPVATGGWDLRGPAIDWLRKWGVSPGLIPQTRVSFESTQEEKIEKIDALGLDWFVDDLIEIFLHPKFPRSTFSFCYDSSRHLKSENGVSGSSESSIKFVPSFIELSSILERLE
jgi:hypothetical protein